jgi:hypothetical protein
MITLLCQSAKHFAPGGFFNSELRCRFTVLRAVPSVQLFALRTSALSELKSCALEWPSDENPNPPTSGWVQTRATHLLPAGGGELSSIAKMVEYETK